ncbi:glycerate kinase (plasmid) [Rhodococcus pseudokoreensis]|uniref:Glycerate kinase n=1 Tax=Rhodococcus pseudokoreensis TaxID=2811421 RepID=A0A974W0A3_9NOCA|nr:glycerate kinase [Rhodococcus pseudokoreensis]
MEIGGSACPYGRSRLLTGPGAKSNHGRPLPDCGRHFASAAALNLTPLHSRLRDPPITITSDVDNPLCGT